MKFEDIKNQSNREFKDISSEKYRYYVYPGYVGTITDGGLSELVNTINRVINNPIGLSVSKSGHYVIDNKGTTHFMPFGFVELTWKPKDGRPNVVC